jgi:hypothetical protein
MRARHLIGWLALGLVVASPSVTAQERVTERTFRLTPGAKSPPATLAAMEWLAGRWVGQALGGATEEIWSRPEGGAMLGMYRLVREGEPVFYEILTIVERDGSLAIRLKHFHPDLRGWEEKDEVREFPLVAIRDGAVLFDGMSFHPAGDRLTVYLAIEQPGGGAREETFTYERAPLVDRE